jgi:hypothetical protein
MTSRACRHRHAAGEARTETAGRQIQGARRERGEHDKGLAHATQELLEGQRVHVKPDVSIENRIGDSEGNAVPPRQPRLPATRCIETEDDREQRCRTHRETAQLPAARQRHFEPFTRGEDRPQIANRRQRRTEVENEPTNREHERCGEDRSLRPQYRPEDVLIADLSEPQPVRVKAE